MDTWDGFATAAPRIAAVFARRHAATGHLDVTMWKEGSAERVVRKH